MLTCQWPDPCSTTSCVQCRQSGAYVEIRNSNDQDGPRIWLPVAEWRYLISAIIRGDHALPGVEDDDTSDTVVMVRVTEIEFSRAEWTAFQTAVREGKFDTAGAEPAHVA